MGLTVRTIESTQGGGLVVDVFAPAFRVSSEEPQAGAASAMTRAPRSRTNLERIVEGINVSRTMSSQVWRFWIEVRAVSHTSEKGVTDSAPVAVIDRMLQANRMAGLMAGVRLIKGRVVSYGRYRIPVVDDVPMIAVVAAVNWCLARGDRFARGQGTIAIVDINVGAVSTVIHGTGDRDYQLRCIISIVQRIEGCVAELRAEVPVDIVSEAICVAFLDVRVVAEAVYGTCEVR